MILPIALLLLASPHAHAFSVGDFIELHTITKNENGTTVEESDRQALASFDPLKQEFLSILTIRKPGLPPKDWKFLYDMSKLLADQQAARDLLAHCRDKGGELQDLAVGTRVLHTCSITVDLGDEKDAIWYSPEVLLNRVMERRWTPNGRFWQETRAVDFQQR
ncbi:MAG: hypothetical protein ACXVB9_19085 [Bdellovibrionota bacterium]